MHNTLLTIKTNKKMFGLNLTPETALPLIKSILTPQKVAEIRHDLLHSWSDTEKAIKGPLMLLINADFQHDGWVLSAYRQELDGSNTLVCSFFVQNLDDLIILKSIFQEIKNKNDEFNPKPAAATIEASNGADPAASPGSEPASDPATSPGA